MIRSAKDKELQKIETFEELLQNNDILLDIYSCTKNIFAYKLKKEENVLRNELREVLKEIVAKFEKSYWNGVENGKITSQGNECYAFLHKIGALLKKKIKVFQKELLADSLQDAVEFNASYAEEEGGSLYKTYADKFQGNIYVW